MLNVAWTVTGIYGVGKYDPKHDTPLRCTRSLTRHHKFPRLEILHTATYQTLKARDVYKGNGHNHIPSGIATTDDDKQSQKYWGKRKQGILHAHDQGIDMATPVSRDQSDRYSD